MARDAKNNSNLDNVELEKSAKTSVNNNAEAQLAGSLTVFDTAPVPKTDVNIHAKTDLVLVNPDSSEEYAVAKFIPNPYHGTWRLRHFIETKFSKEVAVVDFAIHRREEVMQLLADHQPAVIGFAFFYDTLEQDLANIYEIRKTCPDAFIVTGGIEATARAEEYIRKLPIDGLLKGEGEYPLGHLTDIATCEEGRLDKDELIDRCAELPGWLFKKSDGEIVSTGPAKTLNAEQYSEVFSTYKIDLRHYKPYWQYVSDTYDSELLEILDLSPKMIRLITSNYCPYGCSFCVSTTFLKIAAGEKKVRVVGATAEEMYDRCVQILSADPEVFIYFDDENFMALPARAKDFCNLVIERGLDGHFGCRATAQMITDEICDLMYKAGFKVVAFGAESWDDSSLKDFNKRLQNDRSDVAIRNILNNNMKCSFNVILFGPKVTKEGLILTCDKVLRYISEDCNVGITTYIAPYPGTVYFHGTDYVRIEGELKVPGTDEVLKFPKAVLPSDPAIRDAAEEAQILGKKVLTKWQEQFDWRHKILPREVSCLAMMYGVFSALGVLQEDHRAEQIETVVAHILSNKRHAFVRVNRKLEDLMQPSDLDAATHLAAENPY